MLTVFQLMVMYVMLSEGLVMWAEGVVYIAMAYNIARGLWVPLKGKVQGGFEFLANEGMKTSFAVFFMFAFMLNVWDGVSMYSLYGMPATLIFLLLGKSAAASEFSKRAQKDEA